MKRGANGKPARHTSPLIMSRRKTQKAAAKLSGTPTGSRGSHFVHTPAHWKHCFDRYPHWFGGFQECSSFRNTMRLLPPTSLWDKFVVTLALTATIADKLCANEPTGNPWQWTATAQSPHIAVKISGSISTCQCILCIFIIKKSGTVRVSEQVHGLPFRRLKFWDSQRGESLGLHSPIVRS